MRTGSLLFALLMIMALFPSSGSAQRSEWVEQVIIANSNKFETMPPFVDYVTVQTYDPISGATNVFDVIKTQSAQDVIIANGKIYVAAQDSIVMYDANTLQRQAAVVDSGLSRLYVFNDKLIVSKQFPIVRFFVEVLNANDLSLVARIQNISGDCKGITSTKDSIYVAVNGGWAGTEGKLAVINYTNWTLSREINFGPNAVGINDLYNYGGVLFSVNETPFGGPNEGSITAYSTYTMTHTNYLFDLRVGNEGGGIKNSGRIGNLLYLTLNYGIGSFNLDTRQIVDTSIYDDPGYTNHIYFTSYDADYVNSLLYMNVGNRISYGLNIVGTTTGDSVTSFATGINADAIAIDYRKPVGETDPERDEPGIALFPNPAEHSVRVLYTGISPVQELLVRDFTGRTLYRNTSANRNGTWIDCSSFPPGIYFVTIRIKDKTLSAKFIKK